MRDWRTGLRGLAFLDTWEVINEDGMIKTRVYRKDTHTDQYLNFQSNHPLEHERGVVKTLAHRAKTVVSEREFFHIYGKALSNYYSIIHYHHSSLPHKESFHSKGIYM